MTNKKWSQKTGGLCKISSHFFKYAATIIEEQKKFLLKIF